MTQGGSDRSPLPKLFPLVLPSPVGHRRDMKQLGNLPITAREMASSTQIRGSESKSVKGAWLTLLLPFIIGCFFYGWAHMPNLFYQTWVSEPSHCYSWASRLGNN